MKLKFLCDKDETLIFHPPLHIKSYGSIIQTKIADDFFGMSFRKYLINKEPTSVTLYL